MTQIPNHEPHEEQRPGGPPMEPRMPGPAREVHRVVRKSMPDMPPVDFVSEVDTHLTPDMRYGTWDLTEIPSTDCHCTPKGPGDVVSCSGCRAVVCVQRHSRTCMRCGRTFCTACLVGVRVNGMRAITCRACADELNASGLKKVWKGVTRMIWGPGT